MIINKTPVYLGLVSFAKDYFNHSSMFRVHVHSYGYGCSEYYIEIKETGSCSLFGGCTRHKIASIERKHEICLLDNAYFSDIEKFIETYEKKHNQENIVTLHMKEDKWEK